MSKETTRSKICEYAANHLDVGTHMDFTKSLSQYYGADPLDNLDFIMAFEDMFSIQLPDKEYETLNDFLSEVEKQLKA